MGFQDWFADSGTTTVGSVNQCFKGNHYFPLHKEAFGALVQIKVKDITKNLQNIHHSLLKNLIELRKNPSDHTLKRVNNIREYKELVNNFKNSTYEQYHR